MFGQYVIYIRDRDGVFTRRINDVTTVKLLEKINDAGSWTITSTTADDQPFTSGDGIVILKDGNVHYSGILNKITSEYSGYNRLYKWTAYGVNDLAYLSRRVCHPDPVTLKTTVDAYYTATGRLGNIVAQLIDLNAGVDAHPDRRIPFLSRTIVKEPGENISVSLRFDNLLTTVSKLLEEQEFVIYPVWDANERTIHYEISAGADMSDKLVFSTALNQIQTLKYTMTAPTGNYVISAGQGTRTSRAFAYAENEDSIEEWGRIEAYHDMRSTADVDLQADADSFLANSEINEGYSAELNSTATDGYKRVWNIGDEVGIVVNGKIYGSRLLQVETSLSYNAETVKPTVGTIDTGQLNPIFASLNGLRSDVNQLLKVSD